MKDKPFWDRVLIQFITFLVVMKSHPEPFWKRLRFALQVCRELRAMTSDEVVRLCREVERRQTEGVEHGRAGVAVDVQGGRLR